MKRRLLSLQLALLLLLATVAGAVPAGAQSSGEQPSGQTSIDVVQVNITEHPTVRLALDIGDSNFDVGNLAVSENGIPVDFEVESVQPVPADYPMAILVDAHPDRVALAQSLAQVIIEAKDDADRVRLVPIDSNPGSQISTQSSTLLNIEANSIDPSETTRLYDALVDLPALFGESQRPQVYVITSGVDVDSSAEKAEALASIDGMDVTVIALTGGEADAGILSQIGDRVISANNRQAVESAVANAPRPRINRVVATFDSTVRIANEVDLSIDYRTSSASAAILVPGVEEETLANSFSTFEPQFTEPLVDNPEARGWLKIAAIAASAVAAGMLGWIIYDSYRDSQAALSRRLEGYATRKSDDLDDEDVGGTILSKIPIFRRLSSQAEGFATERGLMQPIANLLESADLPWKPGEAVTFAFTFALVLSLAIGLYMGSIPLTIITALVFVGVVYVVVNQVASRDRKKFEDQLPGVLGLLATSLRSGQSFLQAMEAVATEAAQPTAREYNRAIAEVRLGRTVGTAMSGISKRMNSSDFEWVVMSTEIQREVGGNLAEVLDIVGDTMMQRTRLRREVRALSAEGRFSAGILLLMPVFLVMFLYANNRPYLAQLTKSSTGWILVGVSLSLMVGAIAWVRKIVDIEV